jgi:hypothetical protein
MHPKQALTLKCLGHSFLKVVAVVSALLLLIAGPANAAKWFIDNTLGEVKPEERVTVTTPQPVQLIFEFQRDGKAVPAAVKLVKPMILAAIKERGDFSEAVDAPVPSGALLNIVFNNVVNKEELARLKKKAFGAGLSFGLGSGVVATDQYLISFEFIPATAKPSIKTNFEHALHMKYGNTKAEIPGTQAKNAMEAVRGVVRQAVARGLNNLAADPGYAAYSAVSLPAK